MSIAEQRIVELVRPDVTVEHAPVEHAPDVTVEHAQDAARRPRFRRFPTQKAAGVGLALSGAALVVGLWAIAAQVRADLPGPLSVWSELGRLLSRPFASAGPDGRGILLVLAESLRKVFTGFAIAAVVAIPIGFVIGASRTAWRALNPIVQLLRPVSPLAWYPLALVLFRDAGGASVFTIAVTALWPTLINTAVGVAGVPRDHRDVARVFRFGRARYVRHVLLPHSMVAILTGLRLSMGIAWMVIVATEMLSGGTGIGFFVWDSYNNGNLTAVVAAILFIGSIGFALDYGLHCLASRFDYGNATA